jgi:hypothetical protein
MNCPKCPSRARLKKKAVLLIRKKTFFDSISRTRKGQMGHFEGWGALLGPREMFDLSPQSTRRR